jgi:hypothetical protein
MSPERPLTCSTRPAGSSIAPVPRRSRQGRDAWSLLQPPGLTGVRAVQITRFGGPQVLDVVDLPDPVPADGQQLFDVSTAGVNYADTHHRLSTN